MHIRLFLCPEHTNAVSRSEKNPFFFFIVLSVGGYKWENCQEVLSVSATECNPFLCLKSINSLSQCQCWIHIIQKEEVQERKLKYRGVD